jgi:MFS family permease
MKATLPIMAVVFANFMIIGMALPSVPLHVHAVLGFGPAVVGTVAGAQFMMALISRLWAGRLSDSKGPKRAVLLGLGTAIAGGAFYLISLLLLESPAWSVILLLIGRALLGASESLVITAGITWAMGRVGSGQTGKAISWVGMAMFASLAIGAPLGSIVFARWGFFAIALSTLLVPLAALALVQPLQALPPTAKRNTGIMAVLSAVIWPGIGFALSGITFGSITSFLTLYFVVSGWKSGALAFSAFAVALILTRIAAGHLPDRFGGARVAVWSLVVQSGGLALIGFADLPWLAVIGAAISGAGFSLVFPSLGIEAVRRAPVGSRGLAMGTYNAFLDATLGFGSPALGVLAGAAGLGSIFIASAVAALLAVPIALYLQRSSVHQKVGCNLGSGSAAIAKRQ